MKLLFIINPASGSHDINLKEVISTYFDAKDTEIDLFELPKDCSLEKIKQRITSSKADRVVAVGGDGTLKLVAECLLHTETPIGIIPSGSANGMAKELDIPTDIELALAILDEGRLQKIHVVKLNDEICIHLSDLGFNAYLVKKFDTLPQRGMWGYAKATWHALWNHNRMEVQLKLKNETITSKAAMVAIANATMYGSGLKINPDGKLDDDLFEVVLVKDYSYLEILKIWITKLPFNPKKIEVFQTAEVKISSKHKAHFQVDGEYIGRVNTVEAKILPAAITVVLPKVSEG
ncbi:YegS/Rv2252/BmrU family lipid kinase [Pedobacter sp. ISL-68]|uniref:diacylglycerol/lipid kinase family protein n=1 Tax=unclassified Pedobacter TaxID=2628915 RepID=UPI001BE87EB1|nr:MULTISPECIES: YegS/Rv2252/BmrU family lipid kinase [unclassified Pedobacter]MBT2559698.1 YegS/Rv2252/BmrU family lipid kinase [Pedobacter sp. ISL-64]MBT2592003.1 YegS/Rv2252/BmrU family lipid kinase [Pedobacter sp. ISL-68]